jgi:hypothetical protein
MEQAMSELTIAFEIRIVTIKQHKIANPAISPSPWLERSNILASS